jgi:hypothetical protein
MTPISALFATCRPEVEAAAALLEAWQFAILAYS